MSTCDYKRVNLNGSFECQSPSSTHENNRVDFETQMEHIRTKVDEMRADTLSKYDGFISSNKGMVIITAHLRPYVVQLFDNLYPTVLKFLDYIGSQVNPKFGNNIIYIFRSPVQKLKEQIHQVRKSMDKLECVVISLCECTEDKCIQNAIKNSVAILIQFVNDLLERLISMTKLPKSLPIDVLTQNLKEFDEQLDQGRDAMFNDMVKICKIEFR